MILEPNFIGSPAVNFLNANPTAIVSTCIQRGAQMKQPMGCAVGAAAILFVMADAGVASAQDRAAELCTPDVLRLCNEFVPDVEQITACMQKKRRQLSAECAAVFKPKQRRHTPSRQD